MSGLGESRLGRAREGKEGVGRGFGWARLGLGFGFEFGFWVPFYSFLFLFYFSLKLNYLNSKEILNSNPYEIKQLKQCISMNATKNLNL